MCCRLAANFGVDLSTRAERLQNARPSAAAYRGAAAYPDRIGGGSSADRPKTRTSARSASPFFHENLLFGPICTGSTRPATLLKRSQRHHLQVSFPTLVLAKLKFCPPGYRPVSRYNSMATPLTAPIKRVVLIVQPFQDRGPVHQLGHQPHGYFVYQEDLGLDTAPGYGQLLLLTPSGLAPLAVSSFSTWKSSDPESPFPRTLRGQTPSSFRSTVRLRPALSGTIRSPRPLLMGGSCGYPVFTTFFKGSESAHGTWPLQAHQVQKKQFYGLLAPMTYHFLRLPGEETSCRARMSP